MFSVAGANTDDPLPQIHHHVIGAHSVPDWYEALDRLLAVGQLSMSSMADAQHRATQAAVESGETVAGRIRKEAWLAPEQTIVTSSCGLNHLPRQVAFGKLKAMTEAKRVLGG